MVSQSRFLEEGGVGKKGAILSWGADKLVSGGTCIPPLPPTQWPQRGLPLPVSSKRLWKEEARGESDLLSRQGTDLLPLLEADSSRKLLLSGRLCPVCACVEGGDVSSLPRKGMPVLRFARS